MSDADTETCKCFYTQLYTISPSDDQKKMVQVSIELNNIPILVETDGNAEMTKAAHLVVIEDFT